MKHKLLGLLILLALLLSGCAEDGTLRGMVVFDGEHRIEAGQVLQGDLVVLAGVAVVEPGATVDGSVWVLGGACEVAGTVTGEVSGLTESLTTLATPPRPLAGRLMSILQQALMTGLLGLALGFWFAPGLTRVGTAAVKHPAVALATGMLAGITGLVLLVLVGFTLILLPLALLLGLGAILAVVVGWVGLGAWLGQHLAPKWPAPVAVALGSLITVAVIQAGALVPVVGGAVGLGAAFWGLGAALLTRFGYQSFRPAAIPEVEAERLHPAG